MRIKIVFDIVIVCVLLSCRPSHKQADDKKLSQEQVKEELVKVNKAQTYSEQSQMEDFIKRYDYKMQTTATGLRWLIYKKNNGHKVAASSIVKVKYEVKLLDGTLCYNSAATGDLEFQIGKTDLPMGLQEGVQLMQTGEKAIFISPSKLGYGLTGDGDMIPPNAVLVYDVELLTVK